MRSFEGMGNVRREKLRGVSVREIAVIVLSMKASNNLATLSA